MITNTLEERKRNINEIKASFQDPGTSNHYQDISDTVSTKEVSPGFFKIKFLVAIVVFIIYVICDKNQIRIFEHTTKEAVLVIERNFPIEEVLQKIEKIWD